MAKKGRSISVDMTDVESAGRVADGTYLAKVGEVEEKEGNDSGQPYLNWKLKIGTSTVYDVTSLQPQALWKLRNYLEALGMEVPTSSLDIDLDDLVDGELGVVIENEQFKGKDRPRVVDVLPAGEVDGGGAEEAPAKPTKGGKKTPTAAAPEVEAEPEEEAEPEADGLDELDRTALKKLLVSEVITFTVYKTTEDDAIREAIRAARAAVAPEAEEEAPPPAVKKTVNKVGAALKAKDSVTFSDDGKDYTGVIVKVDGKTAEVKVGKDVWEIDIKDLTKA